MSINFNRYRAQLRCESIFNCTTLEQWNNANFKDLQLDASQAALLSRDLIEDSKDLYYKGLISLFESIKSINSGLLSWATIKIYYSIYYFLRCTLALNGIALIRHKGLYYLKALELEKPIVKKNNKKYNSDHSGTINYYIDLFSSDILLSQSIDSYNAYEWLMNKREQVNYRERSFNEPSHCDFWNHIASQVKAGKLDKLIKDYTNDNYILCFQEENAILAIPIKRALLTNSSLKAEGIDLALNTNQREHLISLLPINSHDLIPLIDSISETE